MSFLWFKSEFVASILAGEKCDTIRKASSRGLPKVGDVVTFSVGPRPAFARATVLTIEPVLPDDLHVSRKSAVKTIYGDETLALVRLTFRLM